MNISSFSWFNSKKSSNISNELFLTKTLQTKTKKKFLIERLIETHTNRVSKAWLFSNLPYLFRLFIVYSRHIHTIQLAALSLDLKYILVSFSQQREEGFDFKCACTNRFQHNIYIYIYIYKPSLVVFKYILDLIISVFQDLLLKIFFSLSRSSLIYYNVLFSAFFFYKCCF